MNEKVEPQSILRNHHGPIAVRGCLSASGSALVWLEVYQDLLRVWLSTVERVTLFCGPAFFVGCYNIYLRIYTCVNA